MQTNPYYFIISLTELLHNNKYVRYLGYELEKLKHRPEYKQTVFKGLRESSHGLN